MSKNHDHEADEHYHGEPSRVLEGTPFPETVVLYPGMPGANFFDANFTFHSEDVTYWADVLRSISSVDRLTVPASHDVTEELVDPVLSFDGDNPGDFLPEDLLDRSSLLFVPARLRMAPDGWNDLANNDVSVNWLSLDPDTPDGDLAQAVVLSDWIVSIQDDIPRQRSAGTTPGIFHLKNKQLNNFLIALHNRGDPWQALNDLLEEPEVKLRPGFIRDRQWEFAT